MALSFLFGGNTGETPQSIRQKRDLARAILGASNAPKNVGEGLNALGDGLVAGVLNRRADKAEAEGTKTADALFNSIIGGGTGAGSSNAPASSIPMTGAASEVQAGSPQSYRNAIASIESAGSGGYSAVGPTSPSMGRALGRYQVMEANIPQWSREALGREVSADEFLANPQLQDAIFDKKFGGYVNQYGPEGAAQAWFAGPGGVGKLGRKDSLGTSVSAYTDKFSRALGQPTQVASLDPSAGMPQPAAAQEMQASSPTPGNIPVPTARPSAPVAAPAPAPAPTQVAQAQPVQAPQAAPQRAQINPLYLQALNNPWLSEGQRASVKMLIEQDMQAQQQAQEESTWRAREDYKLSQQKADPGYQLEQDYKRAQLEALKQKTGKTNLINAGEGNIYDPDTNTWIKAPSANGSTGGFRFGGNSVEAQALNGLIASGELTERQAQQLAAGKTITDPSTGAMVFLTPQGIFRQPGSAPQQPQPQQESVDLFGENTPQQQPQSVDLFGTQGPTPAPAPAPSAPAAAASAPAAAPSNAGIIPLTAGKPSNQLTESERKNRSLYSVIKPELAVVESNFDALSDPKNQAYSRLPFSEFATTPEYQKAANSLQTIVSSYLYSVSGATATPEEVRKQTDILTPRPGESKESIANKKLRIRTMVNAVAGAGSLPPEEAPAAATPPADNSTQIDDLLKKYGAH